MFYKLYVNNYSKTRTGQNGGIVVFNPPIKIPLLLYKTDLDFQHEANDRHDE